VEPFCFFLSLPLLLLPPFGQGCLFFSAWQSFWFIWCFGLMMLVSPSALFLGYYHFFFSPIRVFSLVSSALLVAFPSVLVVTVVSA